MADETKARSIDETIDLPYNELTEEEIDNLVEYKAARKAQETFFEEQRKAQAAHNEEVRQIHLNMATKHRTNLERLTEMALNRLESESEHGTK